MPAQNSDNGTTKREFEEQRLALVLNTIAQQIDAKRDTLRGERQDRLSIGRKDFTSGVVVAYKYAHEREMLEVRQSMKEAPYFGRVDFVEDGYSDREVIYIGLATLEDGSGDFLIYDWRAPISSMYYQFSPGTASFRAPMGLIRGEMLLKRSYEISNGEIVAIYDASGNVESGEEKAIDEMLTAMLQRNSTGKMRQIVQSIQAEQDSIIRSGGDVVVVQGPAGSGKTIIALHRAAYILYNLRLERQRLSERFGNVSAEQMLVFSPNSIFSDYISRVLPDLHEGQIRQVILERYLHDELLKQLPRDSQNASFQIESKEDHYEYVLNGTSAPDYKVRLSGAIYKTSHTILSALDSFMQVLAEKVEEQFADIYYNPVEVRQANTGQNVFYGEEEMSRIFRFRRDDIPLTERIAAVLSELETRIKGARNSRNVQPSTVNYLEQERRQLEQRLNSFRSLSPVQLYVQFWNSPTILRDSVMEMDGAIAETETPFDDKPCPMLPNLTGGYWLGRTAQHTLASLQAKRILHEDIVPLLLLSGTYRGFPTFGNTNHAVIDDAQDYSCVHYEYIRRCLPVGCSLTVVGDIHQATNPFLNIGSYDDLNRIFPSRISRLELTRSYRSSLEITEFASRILSENPHIESVRSTGNRPKLVSVSSASQSAKIIALIINRLASSGCNSIAVLCKTRQDSEALYRDLRDTVSITLLTSETSKFSQGVFVTPLILAKGLEFDAVIIQDVSTNAYARDEERKMLYTACTRALHDLYLCYSGMLSPLLPIQDTSLYENYQP